VEASIEYMATVGSATTMLSFPPIDLVDNKESKAVARAANEYAATLCDSDPSHFGFFATIPTLLEIDAALEEVIYALDKLHADGVMLMTRYGTKYLGHSSFKPMWSELNARQAVVFIHPTGGINDVLVNEYLPAPVLDYPQETTKTALDMIISGTMRSFPDCKVILSHAGGNLPYIIGRAASLVPSLAGLKDKPPHEFIEDARAFYFDLALSTTSHTLDTLLKNMPIDHIMYGSDFPFGPAVATLPLARALDAYEMDDETRAKVYETNALRLFPR